MPKIKRHTAHCGIDPGKTGAIAIIINNKATVFAMPKTDKEIFLLLEKFHEKYSLFVMLEKVHSVQGSSAGNTWSFAEGYGFLKGVLTALGIGYDLVPPQSWMKKLNCMTGGDKTVSLNKAQQLFPTCKVHKYSADAVLIAEYCRRIYEDR